VIMKSTNVSACVCKIWRAVTKNIENERKSKRSQDVFCFSLTRKARMILAFIFVRLVWVHEDLITQDLTDWCSRRSSAQIDGTDVTNDVDLVDASF
jgi:hypothetical protein